MLITFNYKFPLRRSFPLTVAIKHSKENKVEYLWARCGLHERLGETKKVFEGYQQILKVLPHNNAEKYVVLSRDITKVNSVQICITMMTNIQTKKRVFFLHNKANVIYGM